jgi:hypothetical protein
MVKKKIYYEDIIKSVKFLLKVFEIGQAHKLDHHLILFTVKINPYFYMKYIMYNVIKWSLIIRNLIKS